MSIWKCSCGAIYETTGGLMMTEEDIDMPFECWVKGHIISKEE